MPITLNGTTGITTPADTITGNATVGGTLTVGGVNAVAVAPGANGNVLTSNGTVWTSAAPASTASLTLLATLTTTSGTTQSATGLPTTYTNLVIVVNATGNNTSVGYLQLLASANNGSSYGTALQIAPATGNPVSGQATICLASASASSRPFAGIISSGGNGTQGRQIATSTSGAINALQFSWSDAATFNAGTIYIYGWN